MICLIRIGLIIHLKGLRLDRGYDLFVTSDVIIEKTVNNKHVYG